MGKDRANREDGMKKRILSLSRRNFCRITAATGGLCAAGGVGGISDAVAQLGNALTLRPATDLSGRGKAVGWAEGVGAGAGLGQVTHAVGGSTDDGGGAFQSFTTGCFLTISVPKNVIALTSSKGCPSTRAGTNPSPL